MSNREVETATANANDLRSTGMQPKDLDSGAYWLEPRFDDRLDPGQFYRHYGYLRKLHFLLESRLKTRYELKTAIYNFKTGGLIHMKIRDNRPSPGRAFSDFFKRLTRANRNESPLPKVLKNLKDAAWDVESRLEGDKEILNNHEVRQRWRDFQYEIDTRARSGKPWTWTALIGGSLLVAKSTQDDRIWSDSAAVDDAKAIIAACLIRV